jgi:acetyltransferase-like isoleucine patch superfamily enzyme
VIHPTAEVAPTAAIGARSQLWHYVHVREGARIGTDCIVGKDVYIDSGVVIGDRCKIQNGVMVYHPAVIEDGVFLGPGVIVTNDRIPRAVHPEGAVKAAGEWTAHPVTVRHGAAVGAGAVLVAGVTLGPWSLVGAGAVVTRDIPAYGLVVGNPGRLIGYVCRCGVRLAGDPSQAMQICASCGRENGD